MKRIIALKGRGGIGKTTTINQLPVILVSNGWLQVGPRINHGNGVDFIDVFENSKGVRLGIASVGDNFREVATAVKHFELNQCLIVLCACRTFGGTHDAMESFTTDINFVQKTIVEEENGLERQNANMLNANEMFNRI